MEPRKAAGQDFGDIADHGARRRCHDADAPRETGDGAFASGVEQALGRQFLLELFKGELQRAMALRLDDFHQELILAAGFVDVDMAARQHRHAVLRLELQVTQRLPEADASKLRFLVLEREVAMAAGGGFGARDFARHPDVVKFVAEQAANASVELSHREGLADWSPA